MNVPEKHREIAHAWVDGAKIQYETYGRWDDLYGRNPTWGENNIYRIDPLCEYAINRIPEHNREAYVHFHKGGEVEYNTYDDVWADADGDGLVYPNMRYRIKPKTVKRWQWLYSKSQSNGIVQCSGFLSDEEAKCSVMHPYLLRKIPETEKEFPA
jgi:hypothetical protein